MLVILVHTELPNYTEFVRKTIYLTGIFYASQCLLLLPLILYSQTLIQNHMFYYQQKHKATTQLPFIYLGVHTTAREFLASQDARDLRKLNPLFLHNVDDRALLFLLLQKWQYLYYFTLMLYFFILIFTFCFYRVHYIASESTPILQKFLFC